jgi:microcystin-dependent protein
MSATYALMAKFPEGDGMAQPFVGSVMMFAGSFAPAGWATCSGQLLPIDQYETLFNLIGTTYGGDGQTNFALPDLQGRVPIHQGQGSGLSNYVIGQMAGTESVTLTTQQIPLHNHVVATLSAAGNSNVPAGNAVLADEASNASGGNAFVYSPFNAGSPNQVQMANTVIAGSGGSQPHENRQPVLTIQYCISLFGIYPSPT